MLMMFIVYSNAVDDEMVEVMQRHAGGYTKFNGVQGEGGGEPHLGSHVWPGVNNCIMVAVENIKKKDVADEIAAIKDKFPGVGIQSFVMTLKEMM